MKELFDKYQKIKKDLKFDYKSYPIEKIMSIDIGTIIYNPKVFKIREFAKVFLTLKIKIDTSKRILFSMGPYKRRDYYEILNYVKSDIEQDFVDLSTIKRDFKISFKNIFISFTHFFKNGDNLTFEQKLSLSCVMAHTLNIIDELEKNQIPKTLKKFCSFCSAHNQEAILDYYFQKHDIETYTLQHALYFIFKDYPIHATSYENMISNKLLCWGQYTKDEFIKYGLKQEQLRIAGYPKNTKKLRSKKIDTKNILVLFGHIDNNKSNLDLIEVLNSFNQSNKEYNIDFKLHPSLDYSLYESLASKYEFQMAENKIIPELLNEDKYLFTIVYNSTSYYDSYMNNCISLRYRDENGHNSIDVWNDSFSNIEELISKIEFFKEKNSDQNFWDETEKKLEYILGFGTNKYKEILDAK